MIFEYGIAYPVDTLTVYTYLLIADKFYDTKLQSQIFYKV